MAWTTALPLVVILWLCCRPCGSQNVTVTTIHNATRSLRTTLRLTTLPTYATSCNRYYDHCSRPMDDNADGSGPRAIGRAVPAVQRQRMNSTYFPYSRCFCDKQCRQYGDCCLDTMSKEVEAITRQYANGTVTAQQKANMQSAVKWECQHIPLKDFPHTTIYVIGSCPANYPRNGILKHCKRNIAADHYHVYLDMPVTSITTNVTYANIYCAMCHNDTQMHKSSIIIHCPMKTKNCTENLNLWKYRPRERRWRYNNGTFVTIQIVIAGINATNKLDYNAIFGARTCRHGVVSTCPSSWPRSKERHLCATYAFYVKSSNNSKIYKNKYCAKCHHQSVLEQHLRCPEVIIRIPFQTVASSVPSYSMLIDFVDSSGKVGESRRCGADGELICVPGEFCDPINLVCRAYACGRNYDMDANGVCVEHPLSFNGTATGTPEVPTLKDPCPKYYIHMDSFIWLPNRSVYVNATGRTYAFDEYEVVNATTVLVCIDPAILDFGKFSTSQAILSTICVICSLVCLATHIVVNVLLPPLRNLPGINLLCLSGALFVAQFLFEFGFQTYSSFELCASIAVLIHYGFLASFFWMNVMAIDVCRTFARRASRPCNHREYWKYSTYAWLTPFFIVVVAICNNAFAFLPQFDPMYGEPLCWINNRQALFLFFAAPLALLLLENIILFTMTIAGICHTSKMSHFARQNSSCSKERTRFLLYAKLALVMGLTWVFGFVAAFADVEALWYLFIIFNSSQGVFIFLAFTCKRKVYNMLKVRFCRGCGTNPENGISTPNSSMSKGGGMRGTIVTTLSSPPTPSPSQRLQSFSHVFPTAKRHNAAKPHPNTTINDKGP